MKAITYERTSPIANNIRLESRFSVVSFFLLFSPKKTKAALPPSKPAKHTIRYNNNAGNQAASKAIESPIE